MKSLPTRFEYGRLVTQPVTTVTTAVLALTIKKLVTVTVTVKTLACLQGAGGVFVCLPGDRSGGLKRHQLAVTRRDACRDKMMDTQTLVTSGMLAHVYKK
ncbi:hypothetical protein RRG08_014664 [Elysia crispata]|uniref:Uncharacterized protein n=1 Tax=Elysia crispata TaxID=231223 RepID=A0AAE0YJH6_9GAST|nr:hypothetical protein RRG08_014664 [Elysia crispata]